MELEAIRERLAGRFPGADVQVVDMRGGDHIHVVVVWDEFEGMPLIRRHQLVNGLFSEELASGEIHALQITAKTP